MTFCYQEILNDKCICLFVQWLILWFHSSACGSEFPFCRPAYLSRTHNMCIIFVVLLMFLLSSHTYIIHTTYVYISVLFSLLLTLFVCSCFCCCRCYCRWRNFFFGGRFPSVYVLILILCISWFSRLFILLFLL